MVSSGCNDSLRLKGAGSLKSKRDAFQLPFTVWPSTIHKNNDRKRFFVLLWRVRRRLSQTDAVSDNP
jgi:hypothetical protein